MKLIDKDALVAEIERIKHETNYEPFTDEVLGKRYVCGSLLSFLDTLKVKEVDLDTDFGICQGEYCDCGGNINDYEVAKHFFELSMAVSSKAQKGEKVC